MTRPGLPLPPLINALRDLTADDAGEVANALGLLARRLELRGLRLALLEADPLPAVTAGWGTLAAGAGGTELQIAGRAPRLARAWADGGDDALRADLGMALETAVQAARAHLRADRAEERLVALDAALHGITGALSVERVLQLIVDRVRDLADAEYAALGIVGPDGAIERFITSGIDAEARRRIGAVPRGHGLLGLLIREGRSIRIPDIAADPRRFGFPPNHPVMSTFLGVPLTVRGRSVGNLYLTNKRSRPEFSADDQELVERFALHAAIAIENARLAEQVQQLMVIEERERIGADLHDGVIQRIYGVNLSLDEVPELVERQPAEAARRVELAIDALNATIAEIREFIYILRPPGAEAGGLVPALHALAAEVRLQSGVSVEVSAEASPPVAAARVRELVSIAREALSNVTRHSGADAAEMTLFADARNLRLEVRDDGRGFDPDAARGEAHRGLVNMERRAERLGGTLEVVSRRNAGTRIIVTVPAPAGLQAGGGQGEE